MDACQASSQTASFHMRPFSLSPSLGRFSFRSSQGIEGASVKLHGHKGVKIIDGPITCVVGFVFVFMGFIFLKVA